MDRAAALGWVSEQGWLIHAPSLEAILVAASSLPEGSPSSFSSPHQAAIRPGPASRPSYSVVDGVAHVALSGVLAKRVPWWVDGTSTLEAMLALDEALTDSSVRSIVLDISSGGGTVAGVEELSAAIDRAKAAKPLSAHVSDIGASAAYWLASRAGRVTANPSAIVGSIGVIATIADTSALLERFGVRIHAVRSAEAKGGPQPGERVTEGHLAEAQRTIDRLAAVFAESVAESRGMTRAQVAEVANGRVWLARDSLETWSVVDPVAGEIARYSRPEDAARGARGHTIQRNPGLIDAIGTADDAHRAAIVRPSRGAEVFMSLKSFFAGLTGAQKAELAAELAEPGPVAEAAPPASPPPQASAPPAEMQALEAEVKQLREERDRLAKAKADAECAAQAASIPALAGELERKAQVFAALSQLPAQAAAAVREMLVAANAQVLASDALRREIGESSPGSASVDFEAAVAAGKAAGLGDIEAIRAAMGADWANNRNLTPAQAKAARKES